MGRLSSGASVSLSDRKNHGHLGGLSCSMDVRSKTLPMRRAQDGHSLPQPGRLWDLCLLTAYHILSFSSHQDPLYYDYLINIYEVTDKGCGFKSEINNRGKEKAWYLLGAL